MFHGLNWCIHYDRLILRLTDLEGKHKRGVLIKIYKLVNGLEEVDTRITGK